MIPKRPHQSDIIIQETSKSPRYALKLDVMARKANQTYSVMPQISAPLETNTPSNKR